MRLAIWLMTAQGVLFAAETAIIHQLGANAPVVLIALIRGSAGLFLAIALARAIGWQVIRTDQLLLQVSRGAVSLLYFWVMIYCFSHLPFADATAISYTQVAYIVLFSFLILSEPAGWLGGIAAGLGIFGALLIANPGFATWNNAYPLALCGACLNGLSFVLNRCLQRRDTSTTTMFYTSVIIVIGNLPAIGNVSLPPLGTVPWLTAIALCGPLGTYLGIVAVRYASAASLAPYTLVRLLIGFVGGIAMFGEMPKPAGIFGATCIVGACLLSCHQGLIQSWLTKSWWDARVR